MPQQLGIMKLNCPEMMFVQYMPISMKYNGEFRIPENMLWIAPIIRAISGPIGPQEPFYHDYVYVTVKHMYQSGDSFNRSGLHIDGYGTDDINFVWSDSSPTEFFVQDFELSEGHNLSMRQMEKQARNQNRVIFPKNSLLMLDNTMVHRVNLNQDEGFRTFVKISISKNKYALKGNAHNYLFDYDWEMTERKPTRNCPQGK